MVPDGVTEIQPRFVGYGPARVWVGNYSRETKANLNLSRPRNLRAPLDLSIRVHGGNAEHGQRDVFRARPAHKPPRRSNGSQARHGVARSYDHAQRLILALRNARSGILKIVADRLRRVSGDDQAAPLDCFQLRGGVFAEHAWARTPTQPTIIASTVDQIGSRLLFRGYGVSDLAHPINAGLAANDTLILLDEAHCAEPFLETMRAVSRYRTWQEEAGKKFFQPPPFRCVVLSATPPLAQVRQPSPGCCDFPGFGACKCLQ